MKEQTLLITGACGNIGKEILNGLQTIACEHKIIAADYNLEKARQTLAHLPVDSFRELNFAEPESFDSALEGVDIVFLLRPPHLSDIPKYFEPFVNSMKRKGISKVVFLSVQGAESQSFIPHHKVEKLILNCQLDYVFLRPSYFMQNLTTTLLEEIRTENRIYMPSGKLKFNWVDAKDIGLVGAHVLCDFEKYKNNAYETTGSEFVGFEVVAEMLSEVCARKITYESPWIIPFYRNKRKKGMAPAMIFVMLMLHFLPRFGKNEARLTQTVKSITHKEPTGLKEFLKREKDLFM